MNLYKNSHQLAQELITQLSPAWGVSGYEHTLKPILKDIFNEFPVEITDDFRGNFYIRKDGSQNKQTVMLAAHQDEIGLMVKYIDGLGLVHFSNVGGIDQRTLLNQEVIIHARQNIRGIISLLAQEKATPSKRSFLPEELVIDTGYSLEKATQLIKPGDIVSIVRQPITLLNQRIAGKAMDDRAGIAVMAVCLNELTRIEHKHRVVAVATVQEEVGLRGAVTGTDRLQPEIAVAIDVTHAQTPDSKAQVNHDLGKGPVLALGPNIHPKIFEGLQAAAQENRLPYQIEPAAGPTGTDARVIQLTGEGIPTGLVSIPLRYMHTSVETISLNDVVDSGKLLAYYIASLPEDLEELACF